MTWKLRARPRRLIANGRVDGARPSFSAIRPVRGRRRRAPRPRAAGRRRRPRTSPSPISASATRERREVPGAAQGAVLVDDGDAAVEHRGVGDRGRRTDAGSPGRQRRQPEQHERAHDLALDLRPGARGVGADEAALQLDASLRRIFFVARAPKPVEMPSWPRRRRPACRSPRGSRPSPRARRPPAGRRRRHRDEMTMSSGSSGRRRRSLLGRTRVPRSVREEVERHASIAPPR